MGDHVRIDEVAGLVCAAVLDLDTGEVIERFGDAERVDALADGLCARARSMRDAGGVPDDMIFTAPGRFHLLVYDKVDARVMYAESDRETGNVAMTRLVLEAMASS